MNSGFIYTDHILEKFERRGITKKEVEEAVIKGQEHSMQEGGAIKVIYTKKDKKLFVIYKVEDKKIILITTYKDNDND